LRFANERNLEGCPEDFKDAFENANQSTKEALEAARATQQTVKTMRDWETIAGMEKPSTDAERKIQAVVRAQQQASRQLKEVAARYGVQYGRPTKSVNELPAAQTGSKATGLGVAEHDRWLGVVKDKKLLELKPESGVITDRETFAKVWQGWRKGESPPLIDFNKEIVVVVVDAFELTDVGVLRGVVDDPDVRPHGDHRLPLREVDGFSYGIARFRRERFLPEGIKTINGIRP
jgi:hypothetical protein